MFAHVRFLACLACCFTSLAALAQTATIVCSEDVSSSERLAAKEVRRYVYLRAGTVLPIVESADSLTGDVIVVGMKDRPAIQALLNDAMLKSAVDSLGAEQYLLKTIQSNGRRTLLVVGGDPIGTLYAAYRLAEHLGVRFYLHGDVVPDKQAAFVLPMLDETRKPLFERRGIQPFHDFPEGPDWWSRDGYKAILAQLPKLGMNFFGLHTYPEDPLIGPEPLVWIGAPDELLPDGKVKAAYPSRHFTASNVNAAWGYQPGNTGNYLFGAAELFDRDDYGTEYMRDTCPWNKMPPEQCNALFDRTGEFFGDVFAFAHRLGIKTCIGTETPLIIPTPVKERLQAAGKNPSDPAVVQSLYEGMFQRIAQIQPVDYYWLWTPEKWTWEAVKQEQIDATMADFKAALSAAERVKPPFTLATCGWVLGPPQSPALFAEFLPKAMPMSCINRQLGMAPVEAGFAAVDGRPKWAIPWMEDDPGIAMPQLWAGRMRRDAYDALQFGCTGLMGIHWRTRVLGPNVSALAKAAWDQQGWSEDARSLADLNLPAIRPGQTLADHSDDLTRRGRGLPVDDFYADWAQAEFGAEASPAIAAIFNRLDGRVPRPSDWVTGPGSIAPDQRDWQQVRNDYAFVDELAALRPQIDGAGNLARFDYWLNTFRYLRSIAEVRCVWGRFNAAMDRVKAEQDQQTQRKQARELALPVRKELVATFAEMQQYLLATVSNAGELGTVCNWQQQSAPTVLIASGQELSRLLGEDLPVEAMPSKQYTGQPRLFVPDVRTGITTGERFKLRVILLGPKPQDAAVYWRPLGRGQFTKAPLVHVDRGIYTVELPGEATRTDFEYYIEATVADSPLQFPPTAPNLNQTVVVEE